MPVFSHGSHGGPQEVSDRILTVPNLISLIRLLALPLLYLDIVDGRELRGLVILVLISWTDYVDGYIARRFDQISRLGQILDPLIDRLLVAVTVIAMVVGDILPLWLVAALLGRDVLMLVAGSVLLALGNRPPPVTDLGKAATFGVMFSLPLFLLAAGLDDAHLRSAAWVSVLAYGVLYWVTVPQYAAHVFRARRRGDRDDEASERT